MGFERRGAEEKAWRPKWEQGVHGTILPPKKYQQEDTGWGVTEGPWGRGHLHLQMKNVYVFTPLHLLLLVSEEGVMLSHLKGSFSTGGGGILLSLVSLSHWLHTCLHFNLLFHSCSSCFQQVFLPASQVFLALKWSLSLIWPFQPFEHWVLTAGSRLPAEAQAFSGCSVWVSLLLQGTGSWAWAQ